MAQTNHALILAAGIGERIQAMPHVKPKGFLEFGGKPIIARSIDQLRSVGIDHIIIVTGYQASFYEQLAERDLRIQIIQNDDYARSGSMYSLYQARAHINPPFLLLDSDLVYETRALEELLQAQEENLLLVSGFTASGDEVYVEAQEDQVQHLSKDKELLNNIVGEMVGITKIGDTMFSAMLSYAKNYFNESLLLEYEQVISSVTSSEKINYRKIEDLVWGEIDNENHYQRIKENIFPLLMKLKSDL